jgi:RNA polymerase primary sigma factor
MSLHELTLSWARAEGRPPLAPASPGTSGGSVLRSNYRVTGSSGPPPRRFRAKEDSAVVNFHPGHKTVVLEADGDSSVRLYLREIGRIPLLPHPEQLALACRMRLGDDDAREQLIKANLRLVVRIARQYEGTPIPLLDLVGEGNIGLIKAVERFDPNRGTKLSTFAAVYVRRNILRALAHDARLVRLPVPVQTTLRLMGRAEIRLREWLKREPTEEEVARDLKLSPAKVHWLRVVSGRPVPIDAPLSAEGADTVADTLVDDSQLRPDEQVRLEDSVRQMRRAMTHLTPRERKVLHHRFGFADGQQKTLAEVGERLGVTRERIRQIESEALAKLRTQIDSCEGRTTVFFMCYWLRREGQAVVAVGVGVEPVLPELREAATAVNAAQGQDVLGPRLAPEHA